MLGLHDGTVHPTKVVARGPTRGSAHSVVVETKLLTTCSLTIVLLLSIQCAEPVGTSHVQNTQTPSERGKKTSTAPSNEQGGFTVVRFPWVYTRRVSDGEVYVVTTDKYEVRQSSVASSNEFLFAAIDYDAEDGSNHYSDDIYAVRFGSDFQVRKADAREWEAAKRLSVKQDEIRKPSIETETDVTAGGVLPFRGKSFAKSGETWGSPLGLPSHGSRWLAIFSHTSEKNTGPKFPLFGGGPGPGEMFVDVYDTATGEKISAGRAPHSGGQYPDNSFNHALWIEDRYLIVPLDWHSGVDDGPRVGYLIGFVPHK
jgi:hypothetical protein